MGGGDIEAEGEKEREKERGRVGGKVGGGKERDGRLLFILRG